MEHTTFYYETTKQFEYTGLVRHLSNMDSSDGNYTENHL